MLKGVNVLIVAAFVVFSNVMKPAWAQQMGNDKITLWEETQVEPGVGWSLGKMLPTLSTCIEFTVHEVPVRDQEKVKYVHVVDKASLIEQLGTSASVSARYMGVQGSVEVDNRFNKVFESDSIYIAAKAYILNTPKFVSGVGATVEYLPRSTAGGVDFAGSSFVSTGGAEVRLTQKRIKQLGEAGGYEDFLEDCGDAFVETVYRGTFLDAVLSYDKVSNDEYSTISARASGSSSFFSGDVKFSQYAESHNLNERLSIEILKAGHKIESSGNVPTTPEQFEAEVQKMRESSGYGKQYAIGLRRYDSLPGWPKDKLERRPPSPLEGILRARLKLDTLIESADAALANPDGWMLRFDTTSEDLAELRDELVEQRRKVTEDFQACKVPTTKSSCASKWMEFSDLEYRSRMPLYKNFRDLPILNDLSNIDDIFDMIARERVNQWIRPAAAWECKWRNVCPLEREIRGLEAKIVDRLVSSLPENLR